MKEKSLLVIGAFLLIVLVVYFYYKSKKSSSLKLLPPSQKSKINSCSIKKMCSASTMNTPVGRQKCKKCNCTLMCCKVSVQQSCLNTENIMMCNGCINKLIACTYIGCVPPPTVKCCDIPISSCAYSISFNVPGQIVDTTIGGPTCDIPVEQNCGRQPFCPYTECAQEFTECAGTDECCEYFNGQTYLYARCY